MAQASACAYQALNLSTNSNQPIELIDSYRMDQKLDYIHMNPAVLGFVNESIWRAFATRDLYQKLLNSHHQ